MWRRIYNILSWTRPLCSVYFISFSCFAFFFFFLSMCAPYRLLCVDQSLCGRGVASTNPSHNYCVCVPVHVLETFSLNRFSILAHSQPNAHTHTHWHTETRTQQYTRTRNVCISNTRTESNQRYFIFSQKRHSKAQRRHECCDTQWWRRRGYVCAYSSLAVSLQCEVWWNWPIRGVRAPLFDV